MDNRTLFFSLLLTVPLVTACGGGGSGSDDSGGPGNEVTDPAPDTGNPETPTHPTYGTLERGILLDGATNGLSFETGDQTGVVEDGLLPYYTEAEAAISLGGSDIAATTGHRIIPFEALTVTAEPVNADYWTNVGVLLLTADADADPENGIEIEAAARTVADSYSMDFNVDTATFLSVNSSALDDIASATARSTPVAENEAQTWVSTIETTLANSFNISEGYFLLHSDAEGFEAVFELESNGTGLLRLTNTGVLGDNFATTDYQEAINTWSVIDDSDYPAALTGFRLETDNLTIDCFPLKRNRMSFGAFCDNGTFSDQYVLGDYLKPTREDSNLSVAGTADLSLYGTPGSALGGVFSNNTLIGNFTFVNGAGTYAESAAGNWVSTAGTDDGQRFIEDGSGNGYQIGINRQIGHGALKVSQLPIEEDGSGGYNITGSASDRVVVVTDLELTEAAIVGTTYTRYNTSSFAEIGDITLNGDGSTSVSGVTWSIVNNGNGLSLSGAEFDRCTYAGEVTEDHFFYCDTSYQDGYGRFEHWVMNR